MGENVVSLFQRIADLLNYEHEYHKREQNKLVKNLNYRSREFPRKLDCDKCYCIADICDFE